LIRQVLHFCQSFKGFAVQGGDLGPDMFAQAPGGPEDRGGQHGERDHDCQTQSPSRAQERRDMAKVLSHSNRSGNTNPILNKTPTEAVHSTRLSNAKGRILEDRKKSEIRKTWSPRTGSAFGLRSSFGSRPSSFGLWH